MAKLDHAAARRAVGVLTRQIDAVSKDLRKERRSANVRRKAAIDLHLRKLRKMRSCMIAGGWGVNCLLKPCK